MTTSSVSPCRRKELQRIIESFIVPDDTRSWAKVGGTFLVYVLAWATSLFALLSDLAWLCALSIPLAAAALVRLLLLQHELSHRSLFRAARVNDGVALVLSLVTFIPHTLWQRAHLSHHQHFGKLDGPHAGYLWTLSTDQYAELPIRRRLYYRLYRHPAVMLLFGALFYFVALHRFVPRAERHVAGVRSSVLTLNLWLVLSYGALAWGLGALPVLGLQLVVHYLAGTVVIWLFWVQHSHDDGYWRPAEQWDFMAACLQGSSCLRLPRWFEWWTVKVTLHHAHHLAPRVPHYNLDALIDAIPELARIPSLTLRQSLVLTTNALWDPQHQRMVPFGNHVQRHLVSTSRAHVT